MKVLFFFILLFLGGIFSPAIAGEDSFSGKAVKKYKTGSSFKIKFGERCYFVTAHHNAPRARGFIKYPDQDIMMKKTPCWGSEQELKDVSVQPGDEILLVGYPRGRRGSRPTVKKTKIINKIIAVYKVEGNLYNTTAMVSENAGRHRQGSSGGMACKITPEGCQPFGVIVAIDKKKRKGGKRMYISPLSEKMFLGTVDVAQK